MRSPLAHLALFVPLLATACAQEEPLTAELTGCFEDQDCLAHELCIAGTCVAADAVAESLGGADDVDAEGLDAEGVDDEDKEQAPAELDGDSEGPTAPASDPGAEPDAGPAADAGVEPAPPADEPVEEQEAAVEQDAGVPVEEPVQPEEPVEPDPAPSDDDAQEWTCEPAYYGDGECDCGCGALDSDCAAASADACLWDWCPADELPGDDANWQCEFNPNAADASCTNRCGGSAPAGCFCDDSCVGAGDCCPDFGDVCGF